MSTYRADDLPKYGDYQNGTEHNQYDDEAANAASTLNRRQVLATAALATIGLAIDDQLGGVAERAKMKHNPEARVYENPDSNIIMVTLPGSRNNGDYMGELLHRYAFGDSNMVSVKYAEDNIDAFKLAALIKSAIDSINVPDPSQKKIAFYLNSIAVAISVPVFEILQANGINADLIMIDSGLRTREGLRGDNEIPAKLRLDKFGRSRVLNRLLRFVSNTNIPAAGADKDPDVDLNLAYYHRWETVNCDTITQGAQVAALDIPIKPSRLKGFARCIKYIKTRGTDPLIESELTVKQVEVEYGQSVELIEDEHRTYDSHGNGPIWPDGLRDIFRKFFGIMPNPVIL